VNDDQVDTDKKQDVTSSNKRSSGREVGGSGKAEKRPEKKRQGPILC
jgi:hypothetical protein